MGITTQRCNIILQWKEQLQSKAVTNTEELINSSETTKHSDILSVSLKIVNEDGIPSMRNLFPIDICDAYVQETRLKISSVKRRYIFRRNYVTDDVTYIRKHQIPTVLQKFACNLLKWKFACKYFELTVQCKKRITVTWNTN